MRRFVTCGSAGIAVTAALGALAAIAMIGAVALAPRPAAATPMYAAQTKLPCGRCHVYPGGGGVLTAQGQKFRENGHSVR
jgi:hypothetical protein